MLNNKLQQSQFTIRENERFQQSKENEPDLQHDIIHKNTVAALQFGDKKRKFLFHYTTS